jgi:hypothetical protein
VDLPAHDDDGDDFLTHFVSFFSPAGKNGSGASETKHWQDMISKPRQTVVQWHRLKPE